ncbi:MAG: hypothetical protein QOJ29_4717 [Thermoleophilaceae bacterium]|nr:hypothetical protein [Thermoleophilaceae bacterium]
MPVKPNPAHLVSTAGEVRLRRVALVVLASFAGLCVMTSHAFAAQSPVGLGTADSFAVLAGSTVTNTGPSVITGNLGVSPGTAVTGFPPGKVNGTIHAADAVAGQAQTDLTTAYDDAAGRTPPTAVSADLGGQTLAPGVYNSASSLGLTGELTLDAAGDPNAVFIFQAGSTLTTASSSRVTLLNGAQACNVFWQIGSSATLGTSSTFAGNILALTSVSLNDAVTVQGRALARNGAVTLINDTINAAHCAAGTTGGPTTSPATDGGSTGNGTTGNGTTGDGTQAGDSPGAGATADAPPQIARGTCVLGAFRARIIGRFITRVVFSVGGRTLATRGRAPFSVMVSGGQGVHLIRARVSFADSRPAATVRLRYRACAAAQRTFRAPRALPPSFTG